jgi:hypothetical protein
VAVFDHAKSEASLCSKNSVGCCGLKRKGGCEAGRARRGGCNGGRMA